MTKLVKYDLFRELSALQRQFFGDDWLTPSRGVNIPTTDVCTRGNKLVVQTHLRSFKQDDVDI